MNIDICHLGINTDSILQSVCPTGLSTVKIFGERHPNKEWIMNSFSKTDEQAVELHRLIKAFGCCAYFISPKGAKELEEKIFPLSTKTTHIPLVTNKMPACGLDRAANGVYSQLEAFVCQPFLAYTPNKTQQQSNKATVKFAPLIDLQYSDHIRGSNTRYKPHKLVFPSCTSISIVELLLDNRMDTMIMGLTPKVLL